MPEAVVAITGASGALYAERLLRSLSDAGWDVLLIVTREGGINLDLELGMSAEDLAKLSYSWINILSKSFCKCSLI